MGSVKIFDGLVSTEAKYWHFFLFLSFFLEWLVLFTIPANWDELNKWSNIPDQKTRGKKI